MIDIKTIAVTSPGQISTMNLKTPDLTGKEVLVKVHAVALCTLEQRIYKGEVKMPYPCTGGHEVSGEIVSLGPLVNPKIWKSGDRVAVRLLYSCGECHPCRTGHSNACEHAQRKPVREGLFVGPGGLCDYVVVDSSSLFPIPATLSYEEAALTEPLACVVHSITKADIALADDVVVIGGGIMGQFHVMLAKKRGARVIISEIDPQRRKMALRFGADAAIDPSTEDAVQTVLNLTEGRGADVVFNTTPIAAVIPQALAMVAKEGKMIQYSSMHPDVPTPFSPQTIHQGEKTITGSVSPKVEDFYTANRLLSTGIVNCSHLIEKTFPFEKAPEAFEAACHPGSFRVIIKN